MHFDLDPTPDFNDGVLDSHGTQCSGIVGMANNSVCGVGVAYQANIGGRFKNFIHLVVDFNKSLCLRVEV